MNLKFLFKALSFSLVTSFVLASDSNDCNEIREYLEKKSLNYTATIEECGTNEEEQVTELKVINENLQEEDVNKILSYKTIKKLEYVVVFKEGEFMDTSYSHILLPHPGFSEFPSVIVNLPELEELNFNYENLRYVKSFPDETLISIDNESLKLSENLKKLTLSQVSLSNENLKELSTLPNLEEIKFHICSFDKDGFASFENHEKLSKLSITNIKGTQKAIPSHVEKIKSLKSLIIENGYCEGDNYDFNGLDNLESLYLLLTKECNLDLSKNEKLSELIIENQDYYRLALGIKLPMSLNLPNSLKKLILSGLMFSIDNYETIASLPNLEELTMSNFGDRSEEYEIKSLECHNKLRKLTINSGYISKNIDFLNDLVNLTYLDFSSSGITEFPQLENLKKLEYLDLNSNSINDILPEYLSELENLKYFNITGQNNIIRGKVLTNKSLEKCGYSSHDELCIPKDYELNCLIEPVSFETCKEGDPDGRCGEVYGKCPSGQCCSKYGWCGKSDDYCAQGCQSEFGDCKNSPTTTTSTTTTTTKTPEPSVKGKCGPGIGSCSSGYCCSKYGWCGKSSNYCAISEGCQSTYGLCTENNSSVEGKCGEVYGKCPSGQCCSKYGWCGKSDDYCAQGCQSEFGDCKNNPTTTTTTTTTTTKTPEPSVKGKCGPGIGSCSSGYCCSKYGWCGKSSKHCAVSEGCQSAYGLCTENNSSLEGKCGEGYGKCPSGQCCSKHGWCGKTDEYCANGCQSEFGKCN